MSSSGRSSADGAEACMPLPPGSPPSLPAAAREQLVEIAAEVLRRLDAEKVPSALRAVAKFTARRRNQRAAAQIAAVLDTDADFRAAVAEAMVSAAPELAAALMAGEVPLASAPIDVAVLVYLTRPPGWEQRLAQIASRWDDGHHHDCDAEQELLALRSELVRLRAVARGERGRQRAAVAAATARLVAQSAELTGQLRSRTKQLQVAERAAELAQESLTKAQAVAENTLSLREAELRRARARIGELERAAETGRREQRFGRDIDKAKLWLLLDTINRAAAGVNRELSLPAPMLRPADLVESAQSASAARSVADPTGLDRVLALPNVHVVVDGYNVTKTGYGELPLADQRTRLISAMAALESRASIEITIAFDGGAKPPVQPPVPRGVRVLFSVDEIADDLIRRVVSAEPQGRPILVVTSDQEIVMDVRRAGAWTVPSAVLLARLS